MCVMSADTFRCCGGPLVMLHNIFNYVSDGRAPLVEDLGPPELLTKSQPYSFSKH